MNTASTRDKLNANRATLELFFVERSDVIEAAVVAALCRQHALWVGPPGTAKSQLARAIFSQFSDGKHWEGLLTRQTLEDHCLGHLDAVAFSQGREEFRFEGHAPEAHFVFVDECFKATGGLLNGWLGLLNERLVCRGPVRFRSPLVFAIGASNEFGEDDSVAALEDRFLVRAWVDYVQDRGALVSLLQSCAAGAQPPALQPVSLPELEAAQAEAAALPIEGCVYSALADLQTELATAGLVVSNRRLVQCLAVVRAYAWLQGDSDVGPEHLAVLRHVLWNRPPEIPMVEAALANIDKGQVGEIADIVDRALQPYRDLRAECHDGVWTSEQAEQSYRVSCASLCGRFQSAAKEIKSKYGTGVSPRVARRAREYAKELKAAFEQCQKDGSL